MLKVPPVMYLLVALATIAAATDSASVPGINGEDVSLQTLLQRIELMESRHAEEIQRIELMESRHADEIQNMRVKHEEDVRRHEESIRRYDEDIRRLTTRIASCERAMLSDVDRLSSTEENKDEGTISKSSESSSRLSTQGGSDGDISVSARNTHKDNMIRAPTRRLYEGNNIAFSAYLDHDLNHVGTDQVLVMNQVLLNDGNGYNKHTGVFVVPVDGVYSFSFFIGQRDVNQIVVRLTVNSTPEVDGIADGFHSSQDLQGGNTVNLKLSAGDVVMLKHSNTAGGWSDTDHVEGSPNGRFSTFTGFLLYPTDDEPIIG